MPSRGEVYWVEFDPVVGREQGGRRPAVIVSDDLLNVPAVGRVIVIPLSAAACPLPVRVDVVPPEGGLKKPCQVLCEQTRTISIERLKGRIGALSPDVLAQIGDRLRVILGL